MKRLYAVISALLLAGCVSTRQSDGFKLATFGRHIVDAAKQKDISVAEMAAIAKSWGYNGVDLWVGKDEAFIEDFAAAGLKPSAVIVFANLAVNASADKAAAAIDLAQRTGCGRVMVVPGFLDKGEKREVVWPTVMRNLSAFVQTCKAEGLDVVIEDFDHDKALIGSADHIRKAITEIPDLGLVLDTGNFENWGDDVLKAADEFLPRIRHVHMKDRDRTDAKKSVVTGTGRIPMRELYGTVRKSGYKGWYTVECFNADDMYTTLRESVKFFKAD